MCKDLSKVTLYLEPDVIVRAVKTLLDYPEDHLEGECVPIVTSLNYEELPYFFKGMINRNDLISDNEKIIDLMVSEMDIKIAFEFMKCINNHFGIRIKDFQ